MARAHLPGRALLAAAALLLAAGPGAAAAGEAPAATLEQVVAATLATEESLRVAELESRKAGLRTRRYLLHLTPDVRLQGAYARTDAEETGNGGPETGDSWSWALSLTQPLYTGGRATAAYRGQRDAEASQRLQAELTRRALTLAAAEAYYGALLAAEEVRIAEQAAAVALRQLGRARRRVELGEAVPSDELRAEVGLRRLEAGLAAARSALGDAREAVRRLSGLELAAAPQVPAPLPQLAESPEALVAEALAARDEREQARLAVAAAEQDVREKRGRFLPSVALRASWGESGDEPSELARAWSAGVAVELPLYDSGSTAYELRESSLGLEQSRLRAAALARDIEREVRGLCRESEAARVARESLRLAVAASAEGVRLAERRYEVGLADSLEVADAQTADVGARVSLAAAGYRLETLALRLRNALGREPLPAAEEPPRR